MEDLILRYGLPAVFAGAMIEGDITLILVGVLAHLGLLPLATLWPTAVAGLFSADLLWFFVGRRAASRLSGWQFYQVASGKVDALANRLGPRELILARVIYGTRIASMIYWGARRLSPIRFVAIDLLGCLVWSAILSILGYALSGSASALLGEVKQVEIWLLAFVVVGLTLVLALRHASRRDRENRA